MCCQSSQGVAQMYITKVCFETEFWLKISQCIGEKS